jgi:hypothetical protein
MQGAVSATRKGFAEVSLAQSVAGFVESNGFNVVVRAILPCECIVVIDFSPGDIELAIVIGVYGITFVIGKNNCKRYTQDEGASIFSNGVEERSW